MKRQLILRSVMSLSLFVGLGCSSAKMTTSQPQNVATRAAGAEPVLEPTEEDSRWSALYREKALDALMPLRSQRVIVAYRAAHTMMPSEIEGYFAIDIGQGYGLYGATVVIPVGQSIGEQLIRLHRADPVASFESVLSQIKVQRLTTSGEVCPGLLNWNHALHKVRVAMFSDPNMIHLDGMLHRIVVDGFIEVRDNDDDNPAARWATQMLDTLTKCVQSR